MPARHKSLGPANLLTGKGNWYIFRTMRNWNLFRVMRRWMPRLVFWLAYRRGRTPWDTNQTPPELVQTIEGPEALSQGRALDLGCGTGTNVIYLARHGWQAVGVDFVEQAIHKAREKAKNAGILAEFHTGDVTQLEALEGLSGSFDLALDIGCFHSLTPEGQSRYAAGLVRRLRPGATYLLYAWAPSGKHNVWGGISPQQVATAFAPGLKVKRVQQGEDRGRPSAWYWLKKVVEK